jgi:hypothetical protein
MKNPPLPPPGVLQDQENLHRKDAKNAKKRKKKSLFYCEKQPSPSCFGLSLRSLRLCGARFFHWKRDKR